MSKIKRPYAFSLLMTVIILLAPITSGVVVQVSGMDPAQGIWVQALAFVIAGVIGLVISKKTFGSWAAVGLRSPEIEDPRSYIDFLPIIIGELAIFAFGFKENLTLEMILSILVFCLVVGFVEELYFRGIIAQALSGQGLVAQILGTALFFSIGHFANLLGGAPLVNTLFQVFLALSFGFLAIILAISTKSIVIPIIWHAAHNFISMITASGGGSDEILVGALQCLVFIVYGIFLLRRLPKNKEEA